MKVKLNPTFVAFGPLGHPGASVLGQGTDREEVWRDMYHHLCRYQVQGFIPTMFFSERLPLAEQGYHVFEVTNGEIDDAVIASLPVPRWYQAAAAGDPGRKLEDCRDLLPDYNDPSDIEIWPEGAKPDLVATCDHDFGLETYAVVFRTESGALLSQEESYGHREGAYLNTVTCTRCGVVHAMKQKY